MSIERIYNFIKAYGVKKRVNLDNIRMFCQENRISFGEMGYALQILKREGKVKFSQKYGWIAI